MTTPMKRPRINKHAPHWDDAVPEDEDAFRLALMRRIHDFVGEWRNCRAPVCRRQRACVSRYVTCAQGRTATPAREWARIRSKLLRTLAAQKLVNEDGAEMEIQPSPASPGREHLPEVVNNRAHRARGKSATDERQ